MIPHKFRSLVTRMAGPVRPALAVSMVLLFASLAGASYEVQAGDTLSEIARDHGMEVERLAEINELEDLNRLVAGQVLVLSLPGTVTAPGTPGDLIKGKTHEVQAGEYLSTIARRYGVKTLALAEANQLVSADHIVVGQVLTIPSDESAARPSQAGFAATTEMHTVVVGDNLSAIAGRYGTSIAQLARWNRIADVYRIQVGQRLRLGANRWRQITVTAGDTLSEIAAANLSSVADIVTANDLDDATVIHPGLVLDVPVADVSDTTERVACEASWYGDYFAGRPTASGEIFDPSGMTAASHFVALHTEVTVEGPGGHTIGVKINDRGPFHRVDNGAGGEWEPHPDRCIDLSEAAAAALGIKERGHAPVIITFPPGIPGVDELQARYSGAS